MQKKRSDGKASSGSQSTRWVFLYSASSFRYLAMFSRLKLFMSAALSHWGTLMPATSMPLWGVA